jgi:type II secretory pathway pseudopilin PulG
MRRFVKSFTNGARRSGRRAVVEQDGFSVVEELVAMAVVGFGLALLIAMISTGTKGVAATVDRVTAEGLARSQMEAIKADGFASAYATLTPPAGYVIDVAVDYWDTGGSGFVGSDTGSGWQKVTVSVSRGGTPILDLQGYKVNR